MRLKGKVCIVTGGSSGIGRATCQLFAREGGSLVVADKAIRLIGRFAASAAFPDCNELACDGKSRAFTRL